jgi:chromosome segregation ATPase
MHRTLALAALIAAGTAAAAPAADPFARHAALVAEGDRVIAQLIAAEAARDDYDKDEAALARGEDPIQSKVKALNADNAAYKKDAEALAASVKAHNAACGGGAAGGEPKKFKTKEELEAAKADETKRVADCDADGTALDAQGKALDARLVDLQARHTALDAQVKRSNDSIDQQEARGRKLAEDLTTADDAADAWLAKINGVLNDRAFGAKATGVEGCRARREMVMSGKDLKVFNDLMHTCAKNLKR